MRADNLSEYDFEKMNRSERINNKKSQMKYKKKTHMGTGKRLREEVESDEDPIAEYFSSAEE